MSRHATARKLPHAPRRVSGPSRHGPLRPSLRPLPASSPARSSTAALPAPAPWIGVLDRLLRSRAWIWMIGLGLGGIVAMQVSLLKLNAGISRAVESAATLERQNAELEAQVAHLSSGERSRAAATKLGMVAPDAGAVAYLTTRDSDPIKAVRRMVPPSAEARALLANDGKVLPEVLTASSTSTMAPITVVEQPPGSETTPPGDPQTQTQPQTQPQPAATAQPASADPTGGASAGG